MTSRERYEKASQEQWASLVEAVLSGEHVDCPTYKRNAILWARGRGCTGQAIKNIGQQKIMSAHATWRASTEEKERVVKMRLPCSLADALMSRNTSADQEESLWVRLERVCGLKRSRDKIEFILSNYADLTDENLKHLAGEFDAPKSPQNR